MSLTLDPEDFEALGFGGIDDFDFAAIVEERRRPHDRMRLPRLYNRVRPHLYKKPWLWAAQRSGVKTPEFDRKRPSTRAERHAFNLSIPWPSARAP